MLTLRPASKLWTVLLSAALLALACDQGNPITAPPPPPPPPPLAATVTGSVTSSTTGHPVAGAQVRIGAAIDTTDAAGHFEITDLPVGAATLRCTAIGFGDFETAIEVTVGNITRSIRLARIEVFEFGSFALYVPATVDAARGIILALGGPDTRGFATRKPMGAPPAVEPSLQTFGQALRNLAIGNAVAVLGTSRAGMANGTASDQLLQAALDSAAALSGRPELSTVPVLLYGMSGGSRQASGFTVRSPERVMGLFLKVPAGVSSVTSGAALRVPTYMVMAGLDAVVDTAALTAAFVANRGAGALWALAEEPGVPHHSMSEAQREVTARWMSIILALRLPATTSHPLREIAETSGWLGDHATVEVASWADYAGDRASASWLPSQTTATDWARFVYAIDYSDIHGVYDLTAVFTNPDPSWELEGHRYTAVVTLWPQQIPGRPLAGTYADWRLIGPGGDTVLTADSGSVTGSINSLGRLVIELVNYTWYGGWGETLRLEVTTVPAGFIEGHFGWGQINGTFTATRRALASSASLSEPAGSGSRSGRRDATSAPPRER